MICQRPARLRDFEGSDTFLEELSMVTLTPLNMLAETARPRLMGGQRLLTLWAVVDCTRGH